MQPVLELIENHAPAIDDAILAPLVAYNTAVAGPSLYTTLAIAVREGGAVTGGLAADFLYDWLYVRLLVVPESLRGQGWGTRLLQQAEAYVRTRDGLGIWLDTFSFQARGFYEKNGFTCFGEIPGHPRNGARFFMQKRL